VVVSVPPSGRRALDDKPTLVLHRLHSRRWVAVEKSQYDSSMDTVSGELLPSHFLVASDGSVYVDVVALEVDASTSSGLLTAQIIGISIGAVAVAVLRRISIRFCRCSDYEMVPYNELFK
jgi:hypothetical protein